MTTQPREGARPAVSTTGPQTQLSQQSSPEDFGTEFLIYDPRAEAELDVVLGVVGESLEFARPLNQR